jgi:hypothetical protein
VNINPNDFRQIPVQIAGDQQQKPLIGLVNQILAKKKGNPTIDTTNLERQLDGLVYGLYGLTASEIKLIEDGSSGEKPRERLAQVLVKP